VVKPETLVGWHRKALQLFWRWKSRGGRPRVPGNLRALIVEMVREKLGAAPGRIGTGSETRHPHFAKDHPRLLARRIGTQPSTRLRGNHAKAMVACDFAVAVTLRFQILHLFVVIDLGTRKLLHVNATPHPNSAWANCHTARDFVSVHFPRYGSFRHRIGNARAKAHVAAVPDCSVQPIRSSARKCRSPSGMSQSRHSIAQRRRSAREDRGAVRTSRMPSPNCQVVKVSV
jgi:hypothetical protein